MRTAADVVIVGGGIQGVSAAYQLAKRGASVVLLEKRTLSAEATGASAAMLMHQTGMARSARLAQRSIQMYRTLPDELALLGIHDQFDYTTTGSIVYTTGSAYVPVLEKEVSTLIGLGVDASLLNADAIKDRVPFLNTEDIRAGSFCPGDGFISVRTVVRSLAQAASALGAEIAQGEEAVAVHVVNGRVEGVSTSTRTISTRNLINAAGAHANQVAKLVHQQMPIRSNRRDMVAIKLAFDVGTFPIVEDLVTEWYIRPYDSGVLVGVGPVQQFDLDEVADLGALQMRPETPDLTREYLRRRAPLLADSRMNGWAGVRTFRQEAPDWPILGPVDDLMGYWNSGAWGAFGVTLGPIGGKIIADLIIDGHSDEVDALLEFAP